MTEEEKYLDLLAVFHFIVGGLTALFACFPLIHVAVGLAMVFGKFAGPNPPPDFMGWFFVVLGGTFAIFGWALAAAVVVAGVKLKKRSSRTYCLVVAALECMLMPLGTILGVFTIILLTKDPVKEIFAAGGTAPPQA